MRIADERRLALERSQPGGDGDRAAAPARLLQRQPEAAGIAAEAGRGEQGRRFHEQGDELVAEGLLAALVAGISAADGRARDGR